MTIPDYIFFSLPVLAYAETHYSFRGIYSRLKKKEPEVVADAPHRIDPDMPIPVLILLKDSHLFPVRLINVTITLLLNGQVIRQQRHDLNTDYIIQKYRGYVLNFTPPTDISGPVQLDVAFEIATETTSAIYHNDNYRISSHKPLDIYIANEPLPATANWYFGDLHTHSSYTEDQAEFGAPLEPSILLSQAMGLSFFAVTDHSYDLDDQESTYLKNDPDVNKWRRFQGEVKQLTQRYSDFVILPGEEVSAGNAKNRNVHFLILNNTEFIHGKGDSAERWFRTQPDHSIGEILSKIEPNAAAIAAHPEVPTPWLQWLLIRRGIWNHEDYLHDRLNGMQIWNGANDTGFIRGYNRWIELLLEGKKIAIFAGNDAHGNFNRFRQIGFPFWTFRETHEQKFGVMRTALRIENDLTIPNLIKAIQAGHCVITNGPFTEFSITNEKGDCAHIGDSITGNRFELNFISRSTPEFGRLQSLSIYVGDLTTRQENMLKTITTFPDAYRFREKLPLADLPQPCYIRTELVSVANEKNYYCYTNPVWIE